MSIQDIDKKLKKMEKEISQIFGILRRVENKIDKGSTK